MGTVLMEGNPDLGKTHGVFNTFLCTHDADYDLLSTSGLPIQLPRAVYTVYLYSCSRQSHALSPVIANYRHYRRLIGLKIERKQQVPPSYISPVPAICLPRAIDLTPEPPHAEVVYTTACGF